jgi:PPP family 3-phenylpropionic acid transporter
MSLVKESLPIILLSLLHGMTFGAFYVASIGFLGRRVPAALRTSGQALFASVTFGLGGLVGYLLSGVGYDAFGGHRLFALAAMIEFLAAGLVLRATPAISSQTSVRAFR